MKHGGDIYRNRVRLDYSVSLNPYGPPEEVMTSLERSMGRLSAYPDPEQISVRESIAAYEGLPADRILAGSGASELFMATVRAIRPRKALLFEPGYSGYAHALRAADCEIRSIVLPGTSGFHPSAGDADAVEENRPDIVFICDPVNPTGRNLDDEFLTALTDKACELGCAVIVDESYYLLSDRAGKREGAAHRLRKAGERLYVIRSLTKTLALPGIRMGYMMSAPGKLDEVRRQLPEWNLSVPAEDAIAGGCRALMRTEYLFRSRELISRERAFLSGVLTEAGLRVFPAETCFMLFHGPAGLYDALLDRGILIRDCRDYPGLCEGYYRIAVKDHPDNLVFSETLKEVMHAL